MWEWEMQSMVNKKASHIEDKYEDEDDLLTLSHHMQQRKLNPSLPVSPSALSSKNEGEVEDERDLLTISQRFASRPSPSLSEMQAVSFTPQSSEEEEAEDLLTLSQRFHLKSKTKSSHLSKNLKRSLGTKRKGHCWRSLTKLTGLEKSSGTMRCKQKRTAKRKFNGLSEGQTSAIMERAANVQSSLDPKFPSFFKLMLRSHVTQGFFMNFPQDFCRKHLPYYDTTIILEGEDGVEYQTDYLSGKGGLSGGWRGFSDTHNLHEGDAVVFHLVLHFKFKVYIERANKLPEDDGTPALVHLDDSTSETNIACNDKPMKRGEHVNDNMVVNSYLALEEDECRNTMAVATSVASEDMDISELSNMSKSFVDFPDFKIIVNGSIIDSELSKDLQARYYKLCYSKNSYLHDNLNMCINQNMAASIISQTMDIADSIRASNHLTSLVDYKAWDKALEALEMLGMNVGFLRARLNRLMDLVLDSTEEADSERYKEEAD